MTLILAQASPPPADPGTTTLVIALVLGNLVGFGLVWWRRRRRSGK
ncbi:MAG: hypothetical protein H0T53_04710 [Herpetosiphonaceae bacterium]|nr:hypothetical protein [Herpetosiphonaceae bacterium]